MIRLGRKELIKQHSFLLIAFLIVSNGICYWGANAGSRYILWQCDETGKWWCEVNPSIYSGIPGKIIRVRDSRCLRQEINKSGLEEELGVWRFQAASVGQIVATVDRIREKVGMVPIEFWVGKRWAALVRDNEPLKADRITKIAEVLHRKAIPAGWKVMVVHIQADRLPIGLAHITDPLSIEFMLLRVLHGNDGFLKVFCVPVDAVEIKKDSVEWMT